MARTRKALTPAKNLESTPAHNNGSQPLAERQRQQLIDTAAAQLRTLLEQTIGPSAGNGRMAESTDAPVAAESAELIDYICRQVTESVRQQVAGIESRLDDIDDKLESLLSARPQQEYYSTADAAKVLGKSEFTVREYCRAGRVHAEKRPCGRGNSREWMISHEEVQRIQCEGLLPLQPNS